MAYRDELGNIIGLDATYEDAPSTGSEWNVEGDPFGTSDLDRAAELKKKELFRKGKLIYEDNGELIHDSNAMIRAKETANAGIRGVDWLLEASENVVDFGQGEWIGHYDGFMAENQGKRYSMDNKDFIAARDLGPNATEQLAQQYQNATHDDNADKGIYTLRKFDGYNTDGSEKFIYKYGLAEVGADTRYRDQYVQDGFEIVEEKRFAGAEQWEKTWNASQGVLDERTLDNSVDLVQNEAGEMVTRDEASGINFGAGKTELVNRDLLGTDIGKTQEDYDRNQVYSERLSTAADARWKAGMSDSVIDAVQSGGAKLVVDTADFVLDVLTPFGDNTLLNDAKKMENIDKFVGYDRTQSTQALSDAATFWNQGEYLDAIKTVVSDPNTMAESIPMMLGMTLGTGKFTAVSKLVKEVNALKNAGKLTEVAKKEKQFYDVLMASGEMGRKGWDKYQKLKDAPKKLAMMDHFAKNAGFHTVVGALTNNVLDDRIAAKLEAGEAGSVDMMEVLGVYALQLPLLAIDRMSFKAILGMGAEGKALKEAFGSLDGAGKKTILAAVAKKGAEMTAAGAGEGVQEYMQTWGEILGSKAFVGGDGITDVFEDAQNQREALMGGLGGLGAGVQMHAVSHGVPAVGRGAMKAYDKLQETDGEKEMKAAESIVDAEAGSAISSGDLAGQIVDDIVNRDGAKFRDFDTDTTDGFKKALKVMVAKRMKNAPSDASESTLESLAVRSIIRASLNGAKNRFSTDGDKEAFSNTLAFIKKISDDQDLPFDVNDIVNENNGDILDALAEIQSREYTAKGIDADIALDTGSDEYKKAVEESIAAQKNADIAELLGQVESEIAAQVMLQQGSTISLGDDSKVDIDDALFDSVKQDMSLLKIRDLIEKYGKQGGKNFEDVSKEIAKFGFITVTEEGKGRNQKSVVRIRPSQKKYDRNLLPEFENLGKIKKALSRTTMASSGGTFSNFAEWAKSRSTKMMPRLVGKAKVLRNSSRSATNIGNMKRENIWFDKTIKKLEGLLGLHEVGDKENQLSQTEHAALKTALDATKAEMKSAEENIQLHKAELEAYVKDVLKLEGFDINNFEHARQLAGVQTLYTMDENGKMFFGPIQVKKRDKDDNVIQSQQFMRNKMLGLKGISSGSGFDGTFEGDFEVSNEEDLSGTATEKNQGKNDSGMRQDVADVIAMRTKSVANMTVAEYKAITEAIANLAKDKTLTKEERKALRTMYAGMSKASIDALADKNTIHAKDDARIREEKRQAEIEAAKQKKEKKESKTEESKTKEEYVITKNGNKITVEFGNGNEIVGQIDGDTIQVKSLQVAEESRGKGIATELYKQLFAEAKKHGVTIAVSDSSVSENASRLWRKLDGVVENTEQIVHYPNIDPLFVRNATKDGSPVFSINLVAATEEVVETTDTGSVQDRLDVLEKAIYDAKTITSENINEFVSGLESFIEDTDQTEKNQISDAVERVRKSLKDSIRSDVTVLQRMNEEYQKLKTERRDTKNGSLMKNLSERIQNRLHSIFRKMKAYVQSALKIITDVEKKQMLEQSLDQLESMLGDGTSDAGVIGMIKAINTEYAGLQSRTSGRMNDAVYAKIDKAIKRFKTANPVKSVETIDAEATQSDAKTEVEEHPEEVILEDTISEPDAEETTEVVETDISGEFTFADVDFSEHEDLSGFEYDDDVDNVKELTEAELKQNIEDSIIKDNKKAQEDC